MSRRRSPARARITRYESFDEAVRLAEERERADRERRRAKAVQNAARRDLAQRRQAAMAAEDQFRRIDHLMRQPPGR